MHYEAQRKTAEKSVFQQEPQLYNV